MSKIAVLFPDISYTIDYPLFYYAKKFLVEEGFEIMEFKYNMDNSKYHRIVLEEYSGELTAQLKEKMFEYVVQAENNGAKHLKDDLFKDKEQILFVSKGIGSVISALFSKRHDVASKHIMFAPLEAAFQFLNQEEGIVLCGDSDEYVNLDRLRECCDKTNFVLYHFEKCNHLLESNSVGTDISNMKTIVEMMSSFITKCNKTVYDFEVRNLDQEMVSLSKYEDEVLLIVNTATGCGFTPQYTKLQEMYETYHKQGFSIVDFPCNQFMNQAPGSNKEIHSFCESRYNISFQQYGKLNVNGEREDKLYTFLKEKRGFKGFDLTTLDGQYLDKKCRSEFPDYDKNNDIKWNFTKFLINRKGQVVERYEPTDDFSKIQKDIEKLL